MLIGSEVLLLSGSTNPPSKRQQHGLFCSLLIHVALVKLDSVERHYGLKQPSPKDHLRHNTRQSSLALQIIQQYVQIEFGRGSQMSIGMRITSWATDKQRSLAHEYQLPLQSTNRFFASETAAATWNLSVITCKTKKECTCGDLETLS